MSSDRRATTRLSLMKLAEHGGLSGPHKDGFGVGYYEGLDVRLIREAEAAADSDWVRFLEAHDLRSGMVIALVRKATIGERSYRNTQPFARELNGRMHLFAHNGCLPGIDEAPALRSRRFHPVGETDSERGFCALLDRMSDVWARPGDMPSLEDRIAVVASFASALRALGPANFLYSDGDALFAHGDRRRNDTSAEFAPPGLVFLERRCHAGEQGFVTEGVAVAGADQTITLVASVPLSEDPWCPFDEGEVLVVVRGRVAARHPAPAPIAAAESPMNSVRKTS
jgi:glutamine amidotransferase